MTIVNCGNKTTAQSEEAEKEKAKIDIENLVITGNPEQLMELDSTLLEYVKSAHINNADDVKEFEKVLAEVKGMMSAVSDTLNARITNMSPEEKGDLVAEVTVISEKVDKNNTTLMKEIQRLEMEAKKIGLTLPIDL